MFDDGQWHTILEQRRDLQGVCRNTSAQCAQSRSHARTDRGNRHRKHALLTKSAYDFPGNLKATQTFLLQSLRAWDETDKCDFACSQDAQQPPLAESSICFPTQQLLQPTTRNPSIAAVINCSRHEQHERIRKEKQLELSKHMRTKNARADNHLDALATPIFC
jgi:hypothetical protein